MYSGVISQWDYACHSKLCVQSKTLRQGNVFKAQMRRITLSYFESIILGNKNKQQECCESKVGKAVAEQVSLQKYFLHKAVVAFV